MPTSRYFNMKTVLTSLAHGFLARKEAPAHPDAFARSWPSLGRRSGRRPDSPLVHPGARTHGEIRGRNTPARFRHGASPLSPVILMTPCLGGCALTYASARCVLCAHIKQTKVSTNRTQQKKHLQHNDIRSSSRQAPVSYTHLTLPTILLV